VLILQISDTTDNNINFHFTLTVLLHAQLVKFENLK